MKPHILISEKPLDRGSDVLSACRHTVKSAVEVFFWNDSAQPDYSEFLTAFQLCGHCLDVLRSSEFEPGRPMYIYGVVDGNEAVQRQVELMEMSA